MRMRGALPRARLPQAGQGQGAADARQALLPKRGSGHWRVSRRSWTRPMLEPHVKKTSPLRAHATAPQHSTTRSQRRQAPRSTQDPCRACSAQGHFAHGMDARGYKVSRQQGLWRCNAVPNSQPTSGHPTCADTPPDCGSSSILRAPDSAESKSRLPHCSCMGWGGIWSPRAVTTRSTVEAAQCDSAVVPEATASCTAALSRARRSRLQLAIGRVAEPVVCGSSP